MAHVEVEISMSVDGFITGPNETGAGLGDGGDILHAWFWQDPDRKALADDALFATSGAVVTSRKIYDGTDGWGETGFYGMPVFVLTHHPHDPVVKGETTFTFVTDGIESAITQARSAAGDKKVHVMGGASVVQQALNAGIVDSLHLHVAPVVLGAGTRLFDNLTGVIELKRTEVVESKFGTHLRFRVLKSTAGSEPSIGTLGRGAVATRLPAQDLERARAFYSQKLGLEPVEERPGGLLYRCTAGEFALFESAGAPSGSHTQMAWEVADLDEAVAELSGRGVEFEKYDLPGLRTIDGIAEAAGNYPSKGGRGERAAWFNDSEGNLLAIGQPLR